MQLFPRSQHGFRAKRSTFTAVSSMHEQRIKNKERNFHQAVAFLDLSAAFDTLSKDIVCQKRKAYVEWCQSYLSERKQQVMIGSTLSEPTTLKVGSPQGSILSPTIFIILLSDIELWCPGATLCGYADDTSITIIDRDMNKLKTTCSKSLGSK